MLSVMVDVRIVSSEGDTLWTEAKLTASEDHDEDYIDWSLDVPLRTGENLMVNPVELRRALDIIAGERAKLMTDAEKIRVS